MKLLNLAVLLCLLLSAQARRHQDADAADPTPAPEQLADFSDADHQVFYRVLGNGIFGNQAIFDGNETQSVHVWLPNVCRKELNSEQLLSLKLKAQTYLELWQNIAQAKVSDFNSCDSDQVKDYIKELDAFELSSEEEEDEPQQDPAQGSDDTKADDEPATPAADDEEKKASCSKKDDEDKPEEEQQPIKKAADISDSAYPFLDANGATCFYYAVTKNVQQAGILPRSQIETGWADVSTNVFEELVFNTVNQFERKNLSWLEFWTYMCNQGDDYDFDSNDVLVDTDVAHQIYQQDLLNNPIPTEAPASSSKAAKKSKQAKKSKHQKAMQRK